MLNSQKKYNFTPPYMWNAGWRCWFEIQYDRTIKWFYCPKVPSTEVPKIFELV